ncbi:Uncharacterised protein [Mycobacteroides abscessus subsp. abscessus]|nr:Uncharacterised protein [Mycobacteroides abscessus subsp. abscessus]
MPACWVGSVSPTLNEPYGAATYSSDPSAEMAKPSLPGTSTVVRVPEPRSTNETNGASLLLA